ncbi:MAG: right-handed parallel beta-helix repeat-containing protein [Candidatus Hydrogenedentota bacterium]
MCRCTFICLAALLALAAPVFAASTYYVHPEGSDAWSGTQAEPVDNDGPFATLTAARDAIRTLKQENGLPKGGVTVWVAGGDYPVGEALTLAGEDSGTAEAPIVYKVEHGATARFLGGALVSGFKPVANAEALDRLPEAAREHVLTLDLRGQGIDDYGTFQRYGFGMGARTAAMELFFNGEPMTIARWPNDEWTTIAGVLEGEEGAFQYSEDAPVERWERPQEVWVHGYWTWPWAESHEDVERIDPEQNAIYTKPPHGVYGYKKDRRWYAYNILEELDQPGEYYIDRENAMLYFWPPDAVDDAEVAVSILEAPFIEMEQVSHVTFEGFRFEYARGNGFVIRGGYGNRIRGCTFANLGNGAVNIAPHEGTQATWNGVERCTLYNVGGQGIALNGGDRKTLEPGANYAVDNHIHHFSRRARTYQAAIQIGGVRNRAAHNHIHDAPHMAIGYGGNEHIIEYNHIHHVCLETGDAGATYIGRDWTHRENVVRFNFFHDLGAGAGEAHGFSDVQAIYLDDFICDTMVYGNVVVGAGRGVLVGGGRHNTVDNNIFVNCKVGVHVDQRGLGWASKYFDGEYPTLFERYDAVSASQPPYSLRYPELQTIQQDDPAAAKYNHVVRNIFVDCQKWLNLQDNLTREGIDVSDNWTEGDPGFVDPDAMNYQLTGDSPVYALGFQRIPLERVGPR